MSFVGIRRSVFLVSALAATGVLMATFAASAASDAELRKTYMRAESIPYPSDNSYSEARAKLGRTLFFDPRLSRAGSISCASCHNPAFSWGDGLALGIGHKGGQLGRRFPTILNLAWGELYFWDGRADSLEAQALGPIESTGKMNMPLDEMVKKVAGISEYRPMFEAAYPGEAIGTKTVAKAIATFERTIISGEAPFDAWVKGDEIAISASAKRGLHLFNGKANCAACHSGWRFTDDGFHDVGVRGSDPGRGKLMPDVPVLMHAFKTPTLRNADRRAPFMHNGTEATLVDVVDLYDRGGRVKRTSLSDEIKPLKLSNSEKADLVAFLKTLTSEDAPLEVPAAPM